MRKVKTALTIAGSDSGGGAGIQADLKTFAALGVHGMVALTAVTAQNTYEVTAVHDIPQDIIAEQIDAVVRDIGVDAAKTGMLHTIPIIETVAEKIEEHGFPVVVDPVMIAKSGARLLLEEAIDALIKKLIPKATVVTPNAMEAEVIAGMKIKTIEDMYKAAEKIAKLGPEAVVVKGGHVETGEKTVDILYYNGEFTEFTSKKIDKKTTHGTGCSFSAAIAACLAKGMPIKEAVAKAKEFITIAIQHGLEIGRGHGPVNPMAYLYREADRYHVIKNIMDAVRKLEKVNLDESAMPEVRMNIAMAIKYPETIYDVAAIPGRITLTSRGVRAVDCPEFGASRHISKYILVASKYNPEIRAALNMRYSKEAIEACKKLGFLISSYDRSKEPPEIKKVEGMSTIWGAEQAIKNAGGKVPDIVYHKGDFGKEPMIVILGKDALDVVDKLLKIMECMKNVQGKNS